MSARTTPRKPREHRHKCALCRAHLRSSAERTGPEHFGVQFGHGAFKVYDANRVQQFNVVEVFIGPNGRALFYSDHRCDCRGSSSGWCAEWVEGEYFIEPPAGVEIC